MTAKEYRSLAWGRLSGNWGVMILTYLIFSVLIGVATGTFVGSIIVTGPLTLGYAIVTLTLIRGKEPKLEQLFDGFTTCFANSFLASILMTVFTVLWTLLLIIPGIVASFSYAMTFYILKDHPELSATDAIKRSKEMMNGHKWELFCLKFSFIGWWILVILTFGILSFMVAPYEEAAIAAFYEIIKGEPTIPEGTATDEGTSF